MSYDLTWVTNGDCICGNIMRHHRSCSDDSTISDSHSRKYCNVGTKPHIFTDCYGTVIEDTLKTLDRVKRMICTDKAASRSDQGSMMAGNICSLQIIQVGQ